MQSDPTTQESPSSVLESMKPPLRPRGTPLALRTDRETDELVLIGHVGASSAGGGHSDGEAPGVDENTVAALGSRDGEDPNGLRLAHEASEAEGGTTDGQTPTETMYEDTTTLPVTIVAPREGSRVSEVNDAEASGLLTSTQMTASQSSDVGEALQSIAASGSRCGSSPPSIDPAATLRTLQKRPLRSWSTPSSPDTVPMSTHAESRHLPDGREIPRVVTSGIPTWSRARQARIGIDDFPNSEATGNGLLVTRGSFPIARRTQKQSPAVPVTSEGRAPSHVRTEGGNDEFTEGRLGAQNDGRANETLADLRDAPGSASQPGAHLSDPSNGHGGGEEPAIPEPVDAQPPQEEDANVVQFMDPQEALNNLRHNYEILQAPESQNLCDSVVISSSEELPGIEATTIDREETPGIPVHETGPTNARVCHHPQRREGSSSPSSSSSSSSSASTTSISARRSASPSLTSILNGKRVRSPGIAGETSRHGVTDALTPKELRSIAIQTSVWPSHTAESAPPRRRASSDFRAEDKAVQTTPIAVRRRGRLKRRLVEDSVDEGRPRKRVVVYRPAGLTLNIKFV